MLWPYHQIYQIRVLPCHRLFALESSIQKMVRIWWHMLWLSLSSKDIQSLSIQNSVNSNSVRPEIIRNPEIQTASQFCKPFGRDRERSLLLPWIKISVSWSWAQIMPQGDSVLRLPPCAWVNSRYSILNGLQLQFSYACAMSFPQGMWPHLLIWSNQFKSN